MLFSNAYTSCPICVPARASFATGLPVHKNRLWDNAMPYHGQIPSWGHSLQSKDVSVESIGKLDCVAVARVPEKTYSNDGCKWSGNGMGINSKRKRESKSFS